MAGFDHKTIDQKWQQYWEREQTFATPTDRRSVPNSRGAAAVGWPACCANPPDAS